MLAVVVIVAPTTEMTSALIVSDAAPSAIAPRTVTESVPSPPLIVSDVAGGANEWLSIVPLVVRTSRLPGTPGSSSSSMSSLSALPVTTMTFEPPIVIGSSPK